MDKREFNSFLESETKKIEIDKINKSKEISADPGDDFVFDWIEKNSENFRKDWNESKCKICINVKDCGWKLKKLCNGFLEGKDYDRD